MTNKLKRIYKNRIPKERNNDEILNDYRINA